VLALQGDVPEHLRALEAAGARPRAVRRPEELDRVDGLVIPGGESTTTVAALRRLRRRSSRCASSIGEGCPRSVPALG
jgi:5'-phosphate synthase pdxT subunit